LTDNLSIVMWSVDQAKENGNVESVTMNGRTIRELTFSPSIDKALEQRGWKGIKPNIIDQSVIEFIIGAPIILEVGREGIKIQTSKTVEVKWD